MKIKELEIYDKEHVNKLETYLRKKDVKKLIDENPNFFLNDDAQELFKQKIQG